MKRHAPEERDTSLRGTMFDPEFIAAEHRRDLGISRSSTHASRIDPAWKESAVEALRLYALGHYQFLAEDVLKYCPVPTGADPRSFGAAVRAAQTLGYIKSSGFAPANSSNRSAKVLWTSLIYRGGPA